MRLWITHLDLTDRANVCCCEKNVFIVLPIIRNQIKTKAISHTLFETFMINNSPGKNQKV